MIVVMLLMASSHTHGYKPSAWVTRTRWHHARQEHGLHALHDRQLMSPANMGFNCRSLEEPMALGPSLSMSPLLRSASLKSHKLITLQPHTFSDTACLASSLVLILTTWLIGCDQCDRVNDCTEHCLDYLPCIELKEQVQVWLYAI